MEIRPVKPNILLERTRYGLHIEHDRWCLDICISIGSYLGTDNVHFLCVWQVTSQEAFNISDQTDPKLSQFLHSKDQRPYHLNNSLTFRHSLPIYCVGWALNSIPKTRPWAWWVLWKTYMPAALTWFKRQLTMWGWRPQGWRERGGCKILNAMEACL